MSTYRSLHAVDHRVGRIVSLLRAAFLPGLLALSLLVAMPQQAINAEPAAQIPGCQVNTAWQIYTVLGGDNLAKIARKFGSSINALVVANCLANPNLIYPGQQLRVPPGGVPGGATQIAVGATMEYFERGFMIWRGDTGLITVYYGNGTSGNYQTFPIWSYALLPDNPITTVPPSGLFKPIFGFGKVWGNYPNVRNALGWARTPEQGYAAIYVNLPPQLLVTLANGQWVSMLSNIWTFTDPIVLTPTPPVVVYDVAASYQPFERGFMIWLGNNGQIYAFYGSTPNDGPNGGSGTLATFPSETYGNLPTNPMNETPPFNRVHPIMGFGKVWWNFPTTRSKLGWGLSAEYGYLSHLRFDNGVLTSLTVPDGRQISVSGGGWGMPRIQEVAEVPTQSVTQTPTPAYTPTPTPFGVEVRQFTVDVTGISSAGVSLNAVWDVSGVDSVELQVYQDATNPTASQVFTSTGLQGSQSILLPNPVNGTNARFVLWGWRGGQVALQREVLVPIVQSTPAPEPEILSFTSEAPAPITSG
jgi:hypothetical protein